MNKQDFITDLAERCEFSKAEAGRALDAILDSLTDAMADREEVSFPGFGKFLSQRRRAREGVNPQDPSQKIRIRAANVPKFRPGASLRAAVAQTPADSRTASDWGDRQPAGPARPAEWKPLGRRK
ncbi:MAG: HU family DNA-binding protein [Thermoleophilia bacterium]|nr:HU family DNA-binding protein [Thermoleophilia bacterium]